MNDNFELWGNEFTPRPRSRLVSLKPAGHGTIWQESLGSLLVRIARAHTCSPLMLLKHEILPKTDIAHIRADGGFTALHIKTMNGVGKYAGELVKRLEESTLQHELQRCTFLAWSDFLDPRGCGLLHASPHWCAACFREWRENSIEPYLPLAWMTLPVTICLKHQEKLSSECPHCRRQQPFISKHHHLDHCSWCGGWLGSSQGMKHEPLATDKDDEFMQYQVNAIYELIIRAPTSGFAVRIEDFRKQLQNIINLHYDGNVRRFERAIGFRRKRIYAWLHSDIKPTLPLLLTMTYRLGTTPFRFLHDDVDKDYQSTSKVWKNPVVYTKRKLTEEELTNIQAELSKLISSERSDQPMKKVASNLGYPYTFIKYWLPDECQKISDLYKHHRHAESERKKNNQVSLAKEIITSLFESNVRVTRRMIQKELFPHRILLSRPEIREAMLEVKTKFHAKNVAHDS